VRVAGQILSALLAAHLTGIIHRDLKPANVMVRKDGTVKVLDFGLARLGPTPEPPIPQDETRTLTQTVAGRIMGTPAYMAPEQREGKPADARSDIYAFGCVLYEMLTAKRVKPERTPVRSGALERIVSRCLQPDPAERWQSADELERALKKVQRPRISWREIASGAAGVALILGVLLVWHGRSRTTPLTDKDVVVLSDFGNTTGDPVFDGTLRQALAIQLEQSPLLKIMDDMQMRQDLRLMGHAASDRITGQIAHDICVRDAAAATIEGSIASLGKAYVLTLQAVNCKNGATLAREQSRAGDKEHVLEALDKAATSMRARLGESMASIEKLTRPLDQFTTASLEALQNYASAHALQVQGQFLAAIPFYQRAVELDPNFAMAYYGLSLAYANTGDLPRRNEYQSKAFGLVNRVSDFERLTISARYYWLAPGDLDRAIDAYHAVSRTYPRYWGSHSELSYLYNTTGEFEKAVEEGKQAVELEPFAEPAYRNLATACMKLDRLAEAKQVLVKAREQHFNGSRLHQRFLELAYLEGDHAAAEEEIQWYRGRPDEYFSFGLQAAYADSVGRRAEADTFYRRAAETALRHGLKDAAAGYEDVNAVANAALADCQPVRRAARFALALALCGDTAPAERLAAEQSKILPDGTLWNAVQLPMIRAAIELQRERPDAALELLRSSAPYERAFPEVVYLRGLVYLRLRKGQEAAAEFRKILDHKGANWGLFYALSDRALARTTGLAGGPAAQK
jgi:tetratricopeptide (TPR) repeat protein